MAIGSAITATSAILTDPYLPKIIDHVIELQKIEQKTTTPAGEPGGGIGLRYVEPAVALFVQMRKHPYLVAAAFAGIVGGIYYLGYSAGKKR